MNMHSVPDPYQYIKELYLKRLTISANFMSINLQKLSQPGLVYPEIRAWTNMDQTIGNFLGNILVLYRPISPKEKLPAEVKEKGEM
jgi:hypothetical protein